MLTKSIEQTLLFNASPSDVYQLLMDPLKHSAFTGSEVEMSNDINGRFIVFDGYCSGYNIELIKDRKIVQAWHFDEEGWPADHFSICRFLFEEDGNNTKLSFQQTDIPEYKIEALRDGWEQYYWTPMKEYLDKHNV